MVYLKVCPFLSNSMCLFIHKTSFQRKKLNLVLWIVLVSLHLAEIMNNLNGKITACSSRFVAPKNKKIIYILCIINMLICSVESMIAISVAAFYISICFLNFQQTSVILCFAIFVGESQYWSAWWGTEYRKEKSFVSKYSQIFLNGPRGNSDLLLHRSLLFENRKWTILYIYQRFYN